MNEQQIKSAADNIEEVDRPTPEGVVATEGSSERLPLPSLSATIWIAGAIVLANIAVWVAFGLNEGGWMEPVVKDLFDWGGSLAPYSLTEEKWRLFTSMFVHAGLVHLMMNLGFFMQLLLPFGLRYGSPSLVVVYLLGGLMATTISAAYHGMRQALAWSSEAGDFVRHVEIVVSVGASGAVMAICGALLASLTRETETCTKEENDKLITPLVLVIGANLVFGLFSEGIDQVQHVAGLAAGFLLGLILPTRSYSPRRTQDIGRTFGAVLLGVLVVVWVFSLSPQKKLREIRDAFQEVEKGEDLKKQTGSEDGASTSRFTGNEEKEMIVRPDGGIMFVPKGTHHLYSKP